MVHEPTLPHTPTVLVCCDRFKGSAAASVVNQVVADTIADAAPFASVRSVSLSDGGAGFIDAMLHTRPDLMRICVDSVVGPLGEVVQPPPVYLLDRSTNHAFIEMATASGLEMVPVARRNPLAATTYGVGQLIAHAVNVSNAAVVTVGLGGSATNDGGLGCLQALGARAQWSSPIEVNAYWGGQHLALLNTIDLSVPRDVLSRVDLRLVTDVTNLLTGSQGSTAVYGAQKGATPEQQGRLERGMLHFEAMLTKDGATRHATSTPGCGAAGGLGAALLAISTMYSVVRGAEFMWSVAGLDSYIDRVTHVITGEGCFDNQTMQFGKTVATVIHRCAAATSQPAVYVLCGASEISETPTGIRAVLPLTPRFRRVQSMAQPTECLRAVVREGIVPDLTVTAHSRL